MKRKKNFTASNGFILDKKGKLLLLKRSLDDEAFPGNWELPGGGVDSGETAEDSLMREIKEECGLSINVLDYLITSTFSIGEDIEVSEDTFLCEVIDDNFDVVLSNEHSEYKWVNVDRMEVELSDYIERVIDSAQKALR